MAVKLHQLTSTQYALTDNKFATVEPITGGNITGPVINGTIFGGAAYPKLYNNQTISTPGLQIYGNTTDGYSYIARGDGVGVPDDQWARLVSCVIKYC